MKEFSFKSQQQLSTCDERLQRVAHAVLQILDISVLEGNRSNEKQALAFESGESQKKAGESKHNVMPSKAMDIACFPIDWENKEQFCYLAGIVIGVASQMGIRIRWGGDWKQTGNPEKNSFNDMDHFELMEDA
jgi:peptidoglycan L-alanyl-D-glutamate endopeptidase CwlK